MFLVYLKSRRCKVLVDLARSVLEMNDQVCDGDAGSLVCVIWLAIDLHVIGPCRGIDRRS